MSSRHLESQENADSGQSRRSSKDGPPSSSTDHCPCDGQRFRRIIENSTAWLEAHIDLINSLNVYPVPDGDTGTNMYLTMQAALREISAVVDSSVSAVARALAHGALMGARGNSGVILSQVWRGVAKQLDGKTHLTASGWAQALREGAAVAYKGVMRPVEGTILTVAREAADAAVRSAAEHDSMEYVLEQTVKQAGSTLQRTPELLPVLKEAGVVDAGGQGLFVILEGMLRYMRGQSTTLALGERKETKLGQDGVPEGEYGYDIQFLVQGQDLPLDEIREALMSMGDSVLVVGDADTIKVHIHSDDPGRILSYATSQGALRDIVLENMQEQYRQFLAKQAPKQPETAAPLSDIAIVAVVNGEGLRRVLESLGVSAIVQGGQTMNPSTEELLQAISALPADKVIILPNNPNIVLAAQQAQQVSQKQVAVIPTRTIPQGISALLAFNYQTDLKSNVDLMERAASQVQTIEVTHAVRTVQIKGLQIYQGQSIAFLNGELIEAGDALEAVTEAVFRRMDMNKYEIITIYWGDSVTQEQANQLRSWVMENYPGQEVELVEGNQPHYQYIISAE